MSTENTDLGYTPPPGVAGSGGDGVTLRSRSAPCRSMSARCACSRVDSAPVQRAEAYLRFTTEGDKNFLKYKSLQRVACAGAGPVGKTGTWSSSSRRGRTRTTSISTTLPRARSHGNPRSACRSIAGWRCVPGSSRRGSPEMRRRSILAAPTPRSSSRTRRTSCAMDPTVVHVKDPGTAPAQFGGRSGDRRRHLARSKTNVFIDQAEVWVDDIRLADVVQQTGMAGALDVVAHGGGCGRRGTQRVTP